MLRFLGCGGGFQCRKKLASLVSEVSDNLKLKRRLRAYLLENACGIIGLRQDASDWNCALLCNGGRGGGTGRTQIQVEVVFLLRFLMKRWEEVFEGEEAEEKRYLVRWSSRKLVSLKSLPNCSLK